MTNTAPVVPPAVTVVEKVAMFGAALLVGVLLATPVTRGAVADSVVTVAHFVADTVTGALRTVGNLFGLL
jgi:hypothetical protein